MQQFARSMGRFTWAMSLFGVQQTMNMVRGVSSDSDVRPSTESFRALTDAAVFRLGESSQITFRAVDRLQQQVIDVGFSVLMLGPLDAVMRGTGQVVNPLPLFSQMTSKCGCFGLGDNSPTGWGPIPRMQ